MERASSLYLRVESTQPTRDETPEQSQAIQGIAVFRSVLSLVLAGHGDQANTILSDAQHQQPDNPYVLLASQFLDQYGMTGHAASACTQVQSAAAVVAPSLARLTDLQPGITPQTLCQVPGSGS